MAKRRTKKEKIKAKHSFGYQWSADKSGSYTEPVNRQFVKAPKNKSAVLENSKSANLLDKDGNLGIIKKNMLKSLIISSLILSLELVLYLAWQR